MESREQIVRGQIDELNFVGFVEDAIG